MLKVRWLKVCSITAGKKKLYVDFSYLSYNSILFGDLSCILGHNKELEVERGQVDWPHQVYFAKKKKAWFSYKKKNTELSRSLLSFIGYDHMLVLSVS